MRVESLRYSHKAYIENRDKTLVLQLRDILVFSRQLNFIMRLGWSRHNLFPLAVI